ncbi:hypothetical protein DER45DRAFT_579025 [Fusarium avenaceum]|nr:hypothetical protein DER45DRAFT_579025 [Fusarium avenaceum]
MQPYHTTSTANQIVYWWEPNMGSLKSGFKEVLIAFSPNFEISIIITPSPISEFILYPTPDMAEAFGIAGSAFGTVSLGFQLFREISQYIDGVEGRDEDLERARNYAQTFQSCLIALDARASNAGISNTEVERLVNQGQANCKVAISNLLSIVTELKGPDTMPNSRTSKVKTLCVRLKYPFKKQNLEKLEKQLFDTIIVLRFALDVLQVESEYAIRKALNSLLARLPEPNGSNCKSLPVDRGRDIVETISNDDVSLRDSTSSTPTSSIESRAYQNGNAWTMNLFCLCRKACSRRSRQQWGPFIIENEMTFIDYHSPGCPLSTQQPLKQQTKRTLKFPIPFANDRWRTASQFSLFFTVGTGGMGFGQSLTWFETVDNDQSPSFQIVKKAMTYCLRFEGEESELLLISCYRRLRWCFANRRASITDVDQYGQSIVDIITSGSTIVDSGEYFFHEYALQIFCILAPFINPATHPNSRTGSPLLAQLCQNIMTRNSTIPGEAISSLLSRCNDSAGQDCMPPVSYHSIQEQFDLIKNFPAISNYLEFGQLSRLVLMEDLNMVQDYLGKHPLSINEINHLGRTPVHIAVQTQNATVLSMLVNHAGLNVLNTKDNNGQYAIDHATDALCHAHKSGKEYGSKVCNGCKVLNVLLHSESAIFTLSVQRAMQLPWSHGIPSCIEGQKNVMRCLASRRKKLGILAQHALTPSERQDLKLCQPGILDQKAAQTQRYLEANNYQVPVHLKVYDDVESPEDSKSIYTLISDGEVAECALQSGFLMPNMLFDDVFLLLAECLDSIRHIPRFQDFRFLSYICWLADHGGDLRSIIPISKGHTTAAHYSMAYLGKSGYSFILGNHVPLPPEVSSIFFDEKNVDDCRCQCSPKGCTPLTKFLAVINSKQTWVLRFGIEATISAVLKHFEYLYGLLGHVGYDLGKEHWFDNAVVRHFTFLILDLRHTCCCLGTGNGPEASGPLSTEDCQEIEEEDCSRLELFEQLAMEFERERGNYTNLLSFGKEYWAPKMKTVDQEIGSYVLAESQKQSAEEAGVIFESYGSQPPPHGGSLDVISDEEEVVSDLEKALRELDKIATDPLRPSLI